MKTLNKSSSAPKKKIAIILIAVLLVLLGGAAVYAKFYAPTSTTPTSDDSTQTDQTNLDPATDEQKQAGDDQKQTNADAAADTDTGETTGTVGVTITYFNQNGSQIQIRTLIDEVTSTGSCTLTLEKSDGTIVTKTSDIQAQPSSSSCKGFDLTTAEITPGTWKATISVKIGTQTGNANETKTIQ